MVDPEQQLQFEQYYSEKGLKKIKPWIHKRNGAKYFVRVRGPAALDPLEKRLRICRNSNTHQLDRGGVRQAPCRFCAIMSQVVDNILEKHKRCRLVLSLLQVSLLLLSCTQTKASRGLHSWPNLYLWAKQFRRNTHNLVHEQLGTSYSCAITYLHETLNF